MAGKPTYNWQGLGEVFKKLFLSVAEEYLNDPKKSSSRGRIRVEKVQLLAEKFHNPHSFLYLMFVVLTPSSIWRSFLAGFRGKYITDFQGMIINKMIHDNDAEDKMLLAQFLPNDQSIQQAMVANQLNHLLRRYFQSVHQDYLKQRKKNLSIQQIDSAIDQLLMPIYREINDLKKKPKEDQLIGLFHFSGEKVSPAESS